MTERCLLSVLRHSPRDTEIIVTDNGSTDGTPILLNRMASQDRRMTIVRNETNLGITGPKRLACEKARAPFFVSLDNDAWVGSGWLEVLRAPMDRDPRVMQVGRKGQHQGLLANGDGYPNGPLEYIDGSTFMVRTEIAKEIGICDPYFPFAYGDDADFSLRLRARGHMLATVDAKIWHPHENDKQDHGGVRLNEHLALARHRIIRRWKNYLERRLFDPTIIIRRSGAIGDVIMASALPRRLKELWPSCRIFMATQVPEVFEGNPHVEGVYSSHEFDHFSRHMSFAWDLDLSYERSLSRPYWKSYAETTVFSGDEPASRWKPDLHTSQEHEDAADRLVGKEPPLVVVHASLSTWQGKNIDPSLWHDGIAFLRERGYQVVEIGTGSSFLHGHTDFNIVGQTSIRILASVMRRAKLYMGIDNAPFHIAGAFGIPSIVFFGCTRHDIVSGTHQDIRPIRADGLDCLGCHHEQGLATALVSCRRGDFACTDLSRVRPSMVVEAIEAWMNESPVAVA